MGKVKREFPPCKETTCSGCSGSDSQSGDKCTTPLSSEMEGTSSWWTVRPTSSPLLQWEHRQLQLLQHHPSSQGGSRRGRDSWLRTLSSSGEITDHRVLYFAVL